MSNRRILLALAILLVGLAGYALEALLGSGRGYLLSVLMLTVSPSLVREGGVRFQLTDPETFVPVMYFLVGGYTPLFHLASVDFSGLSSSEVKAVAVSWVGAIACAGTSVLLSNAGTAGEGRPQRRDLMTPNLTSLDVASLLALATGLVMLSSWVASIGTEALTHMTYVETYAEERGLGPLAAGWHLLQVCAAYFTVRVIRLRQVKAPVPAVMSGALALIGVLFSMNSIFGRRSPLIWLALTVLVAAHLNGVRLRRVWFAVGAVAVLFYGLVLEGARLQMGQGVNAQADAAVQYVSSIEHPLAIRELEAVFGNLVIVTTDQVPSLIGYPGESWVSAFGQQVPALIWPGRPLAMSERFIMWVNPEIAHAGGSLAFGAAAEGYLNFGIVGAFFQIVATTIIALAPVLYCLRKQRGPVAQAFASSVAAYTYIMFRSELASVLKTVLAFVAAVLLIWTFDSLYRALRQGAARGPRRTSTTQMGTSSV